MSQIVNRTSPLSRLERAIKHRQVLILNIRSPLNRPGSINEADNLVRLLMRIAKFEKGGRDGVIDNFDHPPTHQLLILNQRQVRLHASCIAVHHEAYGSGGG